MVSASVVALAGGEALAVYWPIVGTADGVLTGWHYHRHQRRTGVEGPAAPYIVIAASVLVGATLVGWMGSGADSQLAAAVGPALVVAAGYLAFAWLERSPTLAALASVLAALALVLAFSGIDGEPATVILALATGVASVGIGLACRLRLGRPA